MSKSLGNFYTVHELLDEFPGEAIRLLLLKTHYRQPLDFTKDGLAEAKRELDGFYGALRETKNTGRIATMPHPIILEALQDDLNTPRAMSELHRLSGLVNTSADDGAHAANMSALSASAELLGLLQQDPEDWFKWAPKSRLAGLSDADIDVLVAARVEARKAKDFAASDRIRDELKAAGVMLEDGPAGTLWRRG